MKTRNMIWLLLAVSVMQAQKIPSDSWMGKLLPRIGNQPVSQLVLPGAAKAGLDRITAGTAIPEKCNSQLQDTTVGGLLRRGARYLEWSAIYWKDHNWYLGQYHYSTLFGVQVAVGQPLDHALAEVSAFISDARHSNEVVILHISAHIDGRKTAPFTSPYGNLDSLQEQQLLGKLYAKIGTYLYTGQGFHGSMTLNQVLDTVHKVQTKRSGALLLLYASDDHIKGTKPGIIRAGRCASRAGFRYIDAERRTDRVDTLQARWKWLEQQTAPGCCKIMPWVLTWRSTDNKCTVNLSARANEALETWLKDKAYASLPQVISVYFFDERFARQCIEINSNKR